jgi:hypothetical protein
VDFLDKHTISQLRFKLSPHNDEDFISFFLQRGNFVGWIWYLHRVCIKYSSLYTITANTCRETERARREKVAEVMLDMYVVLYIQIRIKFQIPPKSNFQLVSALRLLMMSWMRWEVVVDVSQEFVSVTPNDTSWRWNMDWLETNRLTLDRLSCSFHQIPKEVI